jgi:alanine racemase
MLEAFVDEAERQGVKKYPVHIKINTGMSRLGFELDEADELIKKLKSKDALLVRSVFSHFVGSDEERFDDFTEEQVRRFKSVADKFDKAFDHKVLRHILNSAGIERFTDYKFEMCRLGIGLYGFSFNGAKLRNVCSLKTTILSVKTVKAGETIGYGRHTRLSEDRRIAVIPIGYADGFDRRFSNYGGEVYVRGMRCPVVGNVCMDQAMIDVTGTDARVGDQAEVFGEHITLDELASKLNTITYEILTSVSRRVQRVYTYE